MPLPKNHHGCPYLILAPMEGVGDQAFRLAINTIGGFDEAVTEFIRVPKCGHVPSLAKKYDASELGCVPIAAQIMGGEPELVAEMAVALEQKGAPRIDLNCGCPSNTVTGRGAGSSLLKDPTHLHSVAKAIVKAVRVPVTVKMRSGFEDTSLFEENLRAAEESGISFLTLHPRTKVDGYGPPAKWELIAKAKSILKIPLVGNGDILNVSDALRMLEMTRCDALMIGRGSLINPFLFHEIKAHFARSSFQPSWEVLEKYLEAYLKNLSPEAPLRTQIGKMKQLLGFLFKGSEALRERREALLTSNYGNFPEFLSFAMGLLREGWG